MNTVGTASVRSADRALAIFELFAEARTELGLREIAARCEMPVSTCHALVTTLQRRGYLYTTGRRRELYPTRRLLTVAETVARSDPYLERMAPVLEALRDECGETVLVSKREGDVALYLHVLESKVAIRYTAHPGDFRALHSTALGKALLSTLEPAEFDRWLARNPLVSLTPHTITDPARLKQEVIEGRARGYFVGRGENLVDLTAIAVVLPTRYEALAVLIAGPTHRMEPVFDLQVERLLKAHAALERALLNE
ncbi:MAG TPA: IclR family transcriptional regulator [Burkholderiaceae bacterium]|nr:IclR family transcriptional regulator [Burkholderiaceae bacterium]